MKHLHLTMVAITLALFLYQVFLLMTKGKIELSRLFKVASHVIYLLLLGSGLYLFWQLYQVAGVQHWAVAKLLLLFAAVSANIKAARPTVLPNQAKAGMLLAGVAYAGIITLAMIKPTLW